MVVVNASENYVCISESFSEVNTLMGAHVNGSIPFVSSNGKEVTLEIFVEGDMKFLLTALGLNAANSKFPCQNCKIINISPGDKSKAEEFYYSSKMIRT